MARSRARRRLAEKILEAVPGPKVAAAIAGSAQAVLRQKIATNDLELSRRGADLVSREVGNKQRGAGRARCFGR